MTRPTVRVLALLEILQGGGTRRVPDLAERLGVDERTVRRYVAHLLDLGVPVDAVRGRYGGYRLAAGYRLPPLMLTDDEAVAVLLGLVTGLRVGGRGARAAAESASAKLRRVLPAVLRARVDALLEGTDLGTGPDTGPAAENTPEVDVLLVVAGAARDRRTVELVHTARDGRTTTRRVQPYGVVAWEGRWYLAAADLPSGDVRTFRLDRVVSARPGDGSFAVPPGFDPRAEVLAALARTPWRHRVVVRVRDERTALEARLPPGLATVVPLADTGTGAGEEGWVRLELRAERLDWVPAFLAGLDAVLVVEEPPELRDRVRALGERLVAAAAAT